MAIGLQEVDNLKPSKYFEILVNSNGILTIEQVEKEKSYKEISIVEVINNITNYI